MSTKNGSPPPEPTLALIRCPECNQVHPKLPYIDSATVAWFCSFSRATVYSYKSRHILPAPSTRAGSPRFNSCEIARFIAGRRKTPEKK